ncbi:DJ-1/PfpI family protein [Cytobacillus suaedae]|nr:DJ-1/PfpI family protein [Cytobacillus suaedae]
MNIYILIYNDFAHFEANLIGWIKGRGHELVTVSLGESEIRSAEGFIMKPHTTIDQVNPNDVDLFIVPGGDAPSILGNEKLQTLLQQVNEQNKLIGSICYGPLVLADAGILKERKFTTSVTTDLELFNHFNRAAYVENGVIVDENIVTAKGDDYVDFALTICKLVNLTTENTLNYWASFFRSKQEMVNQ